MEESPSNLAALPPDVFKPSFTDHIFNLVCLAVGVALVAISVDTIVTSLRGPRALPES